MYLLLILILLLAGGLLFQLLLFCSFPFSTYRTQFLSQPYHVTNGSEDSLFNPIQEGSGLQPVEEKAFQDTETTFDQRVSSKT